jgi:hypothetical protein
MFISEIPPTILVKIFKNQTIDCVLVIVDSKKKIQYYFILIKQKIF